MGVTCKIILDNNTVYAGNVLSGRVVYQFDSNESFQCIKLAITGKAYIEYRKRRRSIRLKEKFLFHEIVIYGRQEGSEIQMLAGTCTYPFNYVPPLISPSSCKYSSKHVQCSIKYKVKTRRSTPCLVHKDAKEEFHVIKFMDLNFVPNIKEKFSFELEKKKFWLCFSSQPLTIKGEIPKRGFTPGQFIPIELECKNQSKYPVEKLKAYLRIIIKYYRLKPETAEGRKSLSLTPSSITISKVGFGSVGAAETKNWNKTMEIPKIQPLHTYGCKLLEISYYLYFKVKFNFPHRKLAVSVPIILGNVPINPGITGSPASSSPSMHQNLIVIHNLEDISRYKLAQ